MPNRVQVSGLQLSVLIGLVFFIGLGLGQIPYLHGLLKQGKLFPTSASPSESLSEFNLHAQIVDGKLRQEIHGLLLENSRLRNQLHTANQEIQAFKGEISNGHKRLLSQGEAMTQQNYQTLTLSKCLIDLALAFDILATLSDDLITGKVRATGLNFLTAPGPLQNSLISWRNGTCTEARGLAESHRNAGKFLSYP
jgi:hypothetical protein